MKEIINIVSTLLPHAPFDILGVGVIDFKNYTYEAFEANTYEDELMFKSEPSNYFDIASVTKTLTNALGFFLKPEEFTPEMLLCLSHRGGLPSWGLLPRTGWKEQILSYPINESETLYSDFSPLRVMLEFNKKNDLKKVCQSVWDKETLYWTDLPFYFPTAQTGWKNQMPNFGRVHDPNAWAIGEFCAHAGLFSTVDGLCRTYLAYQKKTDFIAKVKKDMNSHSHRFSLGFDRVENPDATLAGRGCSRSTFGHLGFTGCSVWIDAEKMKGHVILSNAVKNHWFDKEVLNDLRRAIGESVWKS
jgi:CubicO group peptidase (beta-lactamase class C family)